jgi:hypothetical protein
MTLPFEFPDWMPWWLQLAVVVAGLLIGLAFVMMPFSVFGVKSRLDTIESRLDEIQGEIRTLSLRLPEPNLTPYDAPALVRAAAAPREAPRAPTPPPIPPAAWQPAPVPARESLSPTLRAAARLSETRDRAEPRLGKPR